MALLRNPDTSKDTIYVPQNEGQYEDWHKHLEWMWTSKIRDGTFVVIIVSHRGCYIRHEGKFVDHPALTAEQQRDYKETLEKDLEEVCFFKQEEFAHDGRLFIVAPVTKSKDDPESERAANTFVSKVMGKRVTRTTWLPRGPASDVLASDKESCGTDDGRPVTQLLNV